MCVHACKATNCTLVVVSLSALLVLAARCSLLAARCSLLAARCSLGRVIKAALKFIYRQTYHRCSFTGTTHVAKVDSRLIIMFVMLTIKVLLELHTSIWMHLSALFWYAFLKNTGKMRHSEPSCIR